MEDDLDFEKIARDARNGIAQLHGEYIRRYESASRLGKFLLRLSDHGSFLVYDYVSKNDPGLLRDVLNNKPE